MFLIITLIGIYFYLKGDKYKGLLIFLFLLTDGFQFIPEPLMLLGLNLYGKDYALVFTIVIFFSYLITLKIVFPHKTIVFFGLVLLLLYLVVAFYVDLSFYNPSFKGFLLIARVNLFLLAYFWMSKINQRLFERLFRFILILTIIQSILCLIQIPLGIRLLTMGGISKFVDLGFSWIRYTNTPYFILPCLFITLMDKKIKVPYKSYIIILFLLTLLFTLTRTIILGLVFTFALAILLGFFKNQKKVVFWMTAMFILTLPVIGARLLSSTEDIKTAVSEDPISQGSNMTFAYRIFHATERYLYINQDLKHEIFGIGFIHEKEFPKDTFLLGHKDENNMTTQLEQDDISWSNLFLRFGIVGTIIYVFFFITFCISFFRARYSSISTASFMFMIMSFVLTFANGRFSQADFFIIPMFLFFYQLKINSTFQKSDIIKNQI